MHRSEQHSKTITIALDREDLVELLMKPLDLPYEEVDILINDIPFLHGDDPILVRYHETYDT